MTPAVAALPADSVGTTQLKTGAVTNPSSPAMLSAPARSRPGPSRTASSFSPLSISSAGHGTVDGCNQTGSTVTVTNLGVRVTTFG
jgi:hypothetical protein